MGKCSVSPAVRANSMVLNSPPLVTYVCKTLLDALVVLFLMGNVVWSICVLCRFAHDPRGDHLAKDAALVLSIMQVCVCEANSYRLTILLNAGSSISSLRQQCSLATRVLLGVINVFEADPHHQQRLKFSHPLPNGAKVWRMFEEDIGKTAVVSSMPMSAVPALRARACTIWPKACGGMRELTLTLTLTAFLLAYAATNVSDTGVSRPAHLHCTPCWFWFWL